MPLAVDNKKEAASSEQHSICIPIHCNTSVHMPCPKICITVYDNLQRSSAASFA
eukprot:07661.XXX_196021_196182_1 [CDS] Oithona nana genome sequencing.